jgi:hypothetical protein
MSTFSDAFERPAVIKIDGQDKEIKPLTVRDYLPWCAELVQQYQERNTKLIPTDLKSVDKMKLQSQIAAFEVTPDDIRPLIFRVKGTMRALETAALKALAGKKLADITDDDRKQHLPKVEEWIDGYTPKEAEIVAVKLSGLFTVEEIVDWYVERPKKKDAQNPNDQAATNAANQSTGT